MTAIPVFEGFGLGLRPPHFNEFLERGDLVDFVEVISENFMVPGGRPLHVLDRVRARYPVAMHGVSMSIGSADGVKTDYLRRLKTLADRVKPLWISDHLCWTGVLGLNAHDLLPVPLNEETLAHVADRIRIVQEYLERPLVLENPSSYVTFASSTMSEWEFLSRMAGEADCGLLLDVNNVYVSSVNHDFDPQEYIERVPHERIVQFHLAGHTNCETHLIDTHDNHVIDPVWELYRRAHALTGGVSTLLEWDAKIPPFPVVHAEVLKARKYMAPDAGEPEASASGLENTAAASKNRGADALRSPEQTFAATAMETAPHPLHFVPREVQ